ncbi:nuclear transport factor 2 family protein [Nakamurella silvestris]|nr:nuclear transport factor 2 family protein [Nakamurella silvestris]
MTDPVGRTGQTDRFEIHQVVLRYCRGVDRLDLDLVRRAYHPEGIDHHTGFDGGVDEYLDWVRTALQRFSGTMHIIGNHLVDLHGDRAISETYGTAVHWTDGSEDPRRNFTSGFRYIDLMAFRSGRWAIDERWAVREWTRSDAGRLMDREGPGPAGSRDGEDPLARLQARFTDGSPR